jgi:hypothetical protein
MLTRISFLSLGKSYKVHTKALGRLLNHRFNPSSMVLCMVRMWILKHTLGIKAPKSSNWPWLGHLMISHGPSRLLSLSFCHIHPTQDRLSRAFPLIMGNMDGGLRLLYGSSTLATSTHVCRIIYQFSIFYFKKFQYIWSFNIFLHNFF